MPRRKATAATSPLEWAAAAIGLAVALALFGAIGWEAATGGNGGPPELAVRALRTVPAAHGFVVEVEVRNRADATAAGVEIEGVLMAGAAGAAGAAEPAAAETGRATIDYVPGRAARRAGLLFTRDPAGYRLELRATGYREP